MRAWLRDLPAEDRAFYEEIKRSDPKGITCKRCKADRRGGQCLCGSGGDEMAWLPGDRGYPSPAPPETRARLVRQGLADPAPGHGADESGALTSDHEGLADGHDGAEGRHDGGSGR